MLPNDFNELLRTLVDFAEQMLETRGEFYPFAASIDTDGQLAFVAADTGNEHPAYKDVIEALTKGLTGAAAEGQIRATGICFDVRTIPPGTSEKVDAVCTQLEHESGQAFAAFLPYRKGSLGKIEYGEIYTLQSKCVVFAGSEGAA